MSLTTQLKTWTSQNFLTKQQADLIKTYEKGKPSNLCSILLGIFASILISLGLIIMLSNSSISNTTRIVVSCLFLALLSFTLFLGIKTKSPLLRELSIALAICTEGILMLLIMYAQARNSYEFAMSFTNPETGKMLSMIFILISAPYISFSRSSILTILWACQVISLFPSELAHSIGKWAVQHSYGFMLITTVLALLSYGIRYLYKMISMYHLVVLNAIAFWIRVFAYVCLFAMGSIWALTSCPWILMSLTGLLAQPEPFVANSFIFIFLLWQVGYAVISNNANSFARNATLIAIWAVVLSFNVNMSSTSIGFLILTLGAAILGIIWITQKQFKKLASLRAAQHIDIPEIQNTNTNQAG